MTRSALMTRLAFWSAATALSWGCASNPPGGETGDGGATQGGGSGKGGASGHGGTSAGSGGASGSGGSGGTSGSGGSGGASGSGTAGSAAGTANSAGSAGAAGSSGAAGAMSSGGMGGRMGGAGMSGGGGRGGLGGAGASAGGMAGAAAGSAGASAGMAGAGATAGAGGGGNGMSAGCGKAPTIASGMYNNGQHISITAASMQRRYILNVPTNYDNTKPYKLVIAYHELNGNDNEMYKNQYYHLLSLSNNTTIFVAPNGQKNNSPCSGTGTGDSGCGWPNPNNSDIALADALVAEIEQNFCVDTNRIFATGWSYGGSMSYKTACERPLGGTNGFIRAIAVYSGAQLSGNCTPSKPVAYYASHGTHDSVLQYSGGVGLAQNFAKADGCTWMTPTEVNSGAHVCTNLMGCMTGYPVEFCSFNGDHTPDPDNGQSGNSWEYQNVWTFLSQF